MPEQKGVEPKKEFTDTQLLAAQIIAATFPGYYSAHGMLVKAEQEAVSIAHRIIDVVKSEF